MAARAVPASMLLVPRPTTQMSHYSNISIRIRIFELKKKEKKKIVIRLIFQCSISTKRSIDNCSDNSNKIVSAQCKLIT